MNEKNPSGRMILVPVDFSPLACVAMEHGLLLARKLDCKVRLLHVYGHRPGREFSRDHAESMGNCREIQERIRHWREQYGLDAEMLETEGNLFAMIASVARQVSPCLMVMGTHGKAGLQQMYGSYALRIVLDAPCPVLVAGKNLARKDYRRILAPLHKDLDTRTMGKWILTLGTRFAATIHLIPVTEAGYGSEEEMRGILSSVTGQLVQRNVGYIISSPVSPSNFSAAIISYAESNDIDLALAAALPPESIATFDHADWIERLMFNKAGIPVMFINRQITWV